MKVHSIEEIEAMANEITQNISDRIESLKNILDLKFGLTLFS